MNIKDGDLDVTVIPKVIKNQLKRCGLHWGKLTDVRGRQSFRTVIPKPTQMLMITAAIS